MKVYRIIVPLSLLLSACSFSLAADVTPPPGYQPPPELQDQTPAVEVSSPLYPLVPPDPAAGAAIFAEKCIPCHGERGMGDGPRAAQIPNPVPAIGAQEVARQSSPAEWYQIVTEGNLERFMPPFSSISASERWDVVAYAFSLSASDTSIDQGEQLFQTNCAGCHGPQGKGDGPDATNLSTRPKDLTNQSLMAANSGADFFAAISGGVPPDMPAFSDQLSEDERWALSDYLSWLVFTGSRQVLALETTPQPLEPPIREVTATEVAGLTPEPARAGLGTVSGKVTNASGGEAPGDLSVTLRGFDQMETVITKTATLAPDGTYAFQDIEMPVGRVFLASVEYDGAVYGSDIATIQPDTSSVDLPIVIYETTTDTSSLVVDRLHLFLEFADNNTMRVIELFIVSNNSDKTVVAPEKDQPTLTFKLPQGATNLEFQDGALGQRYLETEDGFGDTVAVRPGSGTYQVLFAFDLPYDRKLDLVQEMTLSTSAVAVLVPEESIRIKGDVFQDAGTQDVQGAQYRTYNGGSLAVGEELRLTVTGSPQGGAAILSSSSSTSVIIGLAAFGTTLILAGLWFFQRNRAAVDQDQAGEPVVSPAASSLENTEAIMDAILALDDLYKAGQLPEEAYLERRAELKSRLKELVG